MKKKDTFDMDYVWNKNENQGMKVWNNLTVYKQWKQDQ